RYAGDIAWRHYEAVNGQHEVRTRTELVLRSISAVGNYDYVFDWTFRQDGSIAVAVGVTGVSQVKGVAARTIADDADGAATRYGRLVAPHTVGVNHDHFFCFRLDLDVDGQQNSFLAERLSAKGLGGESPRKSVWVVESRAPEGEQAARLRIDLAQPTMWRVINPTVLGPVGYPVSYQLKPQANILSLLSPDDWPQRRAGFTNFHLWVTPYDAAERYAAGTYPNQSRGDDGLPRWTAANRPIANRDIVLWYTLGVHHVVRAEDWPVMPASWSGFELAPFDFFRRNPALDVPK
ncbi:MAG: tyramine oxidase, partial [Gemmatimonadetes bacterium]|nr:tyramine oxidase [Gemmatimonadota bacterium]